MIQEFDIWSSPRLETNSFSDLSGCAIAIDVDFYLDKLLNHSPAKEPLLPALGGTPFSFRQFVGNDLAVFKQNDIKPVFIFNGLNVGEDDAPFTQGDAVASANGDAWDLYNRHEATEAVQNFGNSGYATPRRYYRLFQQVLREHELEFQTAPYNALGQLAYLASHAQDRIDVVAGPSELLLFEIDKIITSFDFENAQFTFLRKQSCLEELQVHGPEMFTDACMLSGCSFLSTLPSLPTMRQPKIKEIVNILKANASNGRTTWSMVESDPRNSEVNYANKYKRGRLAVKHDVVMTMAGKVEPLAAEEVGNDLHDIIGQRLPDELYYYLTVGAVGTRVLNQLTTSHIYENAPADGGESEVYRSLVSERLTSTRALTLSLLAYRLHRAYHHRVIKLSAWYAPDRTREIKIAEEDDPNEKINKWRVPESIIPSSLSFSTANTSIASAIKFLSDSTLTQQSKSSKSILQTPKELKANALFRTLHLLGYANDDHTIISWGKVLSAMVTALPSSNPSSANLLLACQLLKLDLLTSDTMFPRYTGAPMHGSETDRAYTLLLARVACLGKLRHQEIGFTGPLSRHLLAYSCLVDAVRTSVRDLLEMTLVSMLLAGHAERERTDLTDIALDLPFLLPGDCALGIAVKHYLDDVNAAATGGAVTAEMRDGAKGRGPKELFPHVVDYKGDLEQAFGIWDAVCAGAKVACEEGVLGKSDKGYWEGVDAWVKERR